MTPRGAIPYGERLMLHLTAGGLVLLVAWTSLIQIQQRRNTDRLEAGQQDRYTGTQAEQDLSEIRERLNRLEGR